MINELLTLKNRRVWPRVSQQVPVSGEKLSGYTLNVSLRGARLVTRNPLQRHFKLRLELDESIEVDAETVWEEKLGDLNKVVGVRFLPAPDQEAALQRWMDKVAC